MIGIAEGQESPFLMAGGVRCLDGDRAVWRQKELLSRRMRKVGRRQSSHGQNQAKQKRPALAARPISALSRDSAICVPRPSGRTAISAARKALLRSPSSASPEASGSGIPTYSGMMAGSCIFTGAARTMSQSMWWNSTLILCSRSARSRARSFRTRSGAVPAALVRSHGPLTWGADAAQAGCHAVAIEEAAGVARDTELLSAPQHLLDKHYLRKHGPNAH